jgi:hypothetical protein
MSSQLRQTKQEKKRLMIEGLRLARNELLQAIQAIPPERLDEIFLGEWSVKHLVAHLIGWDYTNRQAVEEILSGQRPSFFQLYDHDWRSYNASLVSEYLREPFPTLLEAVRDSHQTLIDFLESLTAKQVMEGKAGGGEQGRTVTIRNLLAAEAKDESLHAMQVRSYFL